jgi:1-acyl-sn-glycerol-3-phosphate acyltransferase
MAHDTAQYNELIHINTQDFLTSLGLDKVRRGRAILKWLCRYPSGRFARQVLDFDRSISAQGLVKASSDALQDFTNGLEIIGQDQIPQSGPLLILSNHPGMSDTLALFASIPRPDLRIVAAERPFLKALPNVDRRLIYVPEEADRRMGVVRQVVGHLRQGGAVLTFPAGKIEPDPACMPGAVESLEDWSESITVFTRLVPQARVVVAIVSGVIWPAALHHPITRLRRLPKDRERFAAALQIMILTLRPKLRPSRVKVAFSSTLFAGDPLVRGDEKSQIHSIAEQARLLIERSLDQPVGMRPAEAPATHSQPAFSAPAGKPGKI